MIACNHRPARFLKESPSLASITLPELTRPRPSPRVVAWLDANGPLLAVPTVALAE